VKFLFLRKDEKESNKLNKEECWRPPLDDIYKINIGASFHANLKKKEAGALLFKIVWDNFLKEVSEIFPVLAVPYKQRR
jgi:hypothetical protein